MSTKGSGPSFSTAELVIGSSILGVWLAGAYALWLAAFLGGGHPDNPLGWPVTAVQDFFGPDHHRILPWHWVGAGSVTSLTPFWGTIAASLALMAIPGVLAFGMWRGSLPRPSLLARVPKYSKWANPAHLYKLVVREAGQFRRITLGFRGPALLAAEPGASVLVFGPTQSGKTTSICIPSILEWQGPVVAISVKRDLVDQTAGWRQRKGRVQIYDPTGATNLPSIRWSPHTYCTDFDTAWKIGNWISGTIDRGKSKGDSDWGHWRDAAHRLLAASFYAGARLGAPMKEVRAWVDDGSGESLRHALSLVPDCDPTAIEVFQSIQARPERERGSCYSTTQRTLSVFLERSVAKTAEGNDMNYREFLVDGENTLYLIAPTHEQERLQLLFVGLLNSIIEEVYTIAQGSPTGSIPQPLLLVLDECANTAPIEGLPQYLATGYAQGMSLITIFQDLSQIRGRYQELTESIVNNSRAKLFLSGIGDMQTLQLASQLVGSEQHKQWTYNSGNGTSGSSYMKSTRQMMPPDVARQLRPGSGLLLYHWMQPAVLALRPWYQNRALQQRAGAPYIPGATRVLV